MRFMVMVKANKDSESGALPDPQILADMGKFNEELMKAGVLLAGEGLHPSSKGARVYFPDGKPKVQDGPFTEAKELVGGFWMLQVKSKDEAVEWAKKVPTTGTNFVELRQVFEMSEFPEDIRKATENSATRAQVEKHARA